MKETTINGKTYIPVFHETILYGDKKCKACVAYVHHILSNTTEDRRKVPLCVALPHCNTDKQSCHFVEKYND